MPDIHQLHEQRLQAVADARKITEAAEAENRDLTPKEDEQFKGLMGTAESLKVRIDRAAELDKVEAAADELRGSGRKTEPNALGGGGGETRSALELEVRGQTMTIAPDDRRYARNAPEGRDLFNRALVGDANAEAEYRALSLDNPSQGGFLVPEGFIGEFIRGLDNAVFMRSLSRGFVTGSADLGAPHLKQQMSALTWGSEVAQVDRDNDMQVGRRTLHPHDANKEILVSRNLLRSDGISADTIVREEMQRIVADGLEQAYMTGTGAGQPLGVFTASSDGISTSRDVVGTSTTTITADQLIDAKYKLKSQYRSRAGWIFHRDGVAQISKLKDSEGQYRNIRHP